METNKDLQTKQEIVNDVADSIGDGFIIGVVHFAKKYGHLDYNETANKFMLSLLAEMNPTAEIKYPFKNSFGDIWITVLSEISPIINQLVSNGELENAKALGRTIGYGEVLRFLEANAQEAVDELKRISEEAKKKEG